MKCVVAVSAVSLTRGNVRIAIRETLHEFCNGRLRMCVLSGCSCDR